MRPTSAALLAAALIGLTAPAAHADPIAWSYSWSRSPDVIDADGTTTSILQLSSASTTEAPGTTSPVLATNVFTYGNGPNGPPAIFSPTPFTLTLDIRDPASATPGSVSFTGELFGYFTPANDHIQTFYSGTLSKSILIGKHLYNVQIEAFAPNTEDCTTGQITAIAKVTVQSLPEPASAVLAGLALPAAGLFWLRRRR